MYKDILDSYIATRFRQGELTLKEFGALAIIGDREGNRSLEEFGSNLTRTKAFLASMKERGLISIIPHRGTKAQGKQTRAYYIGKTLREGYKEHLEFYYSNREAGDKTREFNNLTPVILVEMTEEELTAKEEVIMAKEPRWDNPTNLLGR